MVLGLKAKNRRGPSVQVEYIIHIQDVKPWPPTQSLKTVRSVLIQWEIGDCNSGSTTSVTPSIDDGKIEFNESFRLTVVLSRDMSVKNGNADAFHKNLLEFNLYEPRRDKTVKGQLLGTAVLDLADYGVVKEITSIGVPMNCTRSFRNTALAVLYLKIQPYDKARSSSSLRGRLSKEASLDKNDGESVSTLMSEEYADEVEVASLSDDDVSSHSSLTASSVLESNGSSPSLIKIGTARGKPHSGVGTENRDSLSKLSSDNELNENFKDYSSSVSVDISSSNGSPNNVPALLDNSGLETKSVSEKNSAPGAKSSTSCQALESAQQIQEEVINSKGKLQSKSLSEENASVVATEVIATDMSQKLNLKNDDQPQATSESEKKSQIPAARKDYMKDADTGNIDDVVAEYEYKHEQNIHERQMLEGKRDSSLSRDRLRLVKSVRSPMDSSRSNGGGSATTMKQESRVYAGEKGRTTSEMIAQELEQRIRMLEGELREAAAIEVALYSIAAEHGSSVNKVHAPARRLSRLYLQAVKGMRRASAAQSAVSGLVVVAKACGNDVPRLTFWLSNCIVLRAIVDATFVEDQLPLSAGPSARNGVGKGMNKKSSTLKWSVSSSDKKAYKNALSTSLDWENPHVFISALEKVESWIFSRIVESVWWQTLTPHMQSSAAKLIDKVVESGSKRFYRRTSSSTDHDQVNFSLELWKKAFKDACERLCPVRAGGHECGCLSLLAKLIMEQCVARLDVAMFNAILRESADDIPTDPVSDPISDANVLPFPAGKSSFGAGAQLKNAIGNWSRWLTDLFGMDDDDAPDDEREDDDDETQKYDSSFKSFHLLKSLSDLMMLPKDMLLNESIRREVCPTLSTEIIKRVLVNFVPDEFCPDPIPDAVFEALDSEDVLAEEEGLVTNFPCTALEVSYSPPSASSLASLLSGYIGSGSQSQLRRSGSVLRRSNTSDDELDGLDSPLNSILGDSLPASVKEMNPDWEVVQNHGQNAIRYQLLRQVWHDGVEL